MKKVLIFIVIFLLFGLGYKYYLFNKYYIDKVDFNTDGIFDKTVTISHRDDYDLMYTYEDLNIKDDFTSFYQNEDFFIDKNEFGEVVKAIGFNKMDQYYLMLKDSAFTVGALEDDYLFTEDDRIRFTGENNIHNDIDLYKYIKENYYLESNIFDSIKRLKEKYIINNFVAILGLASDANVNTITLINGDITGYIINIGEVAKEIHLLHNNEQYMIILQGKDYLDDNYIINLLESVKFYQ